MASLIYNSFFDDVARGNIDLDTHTFKCILVTSTYTAVSDTTKKDSHLKRSDITGEVAAGGGYTSGGENVTFTVTKDTTNDRLDVTLGGFSIPTATITARGAVYYRNVGTAATDNLVAHIDFGSDVVSTGGTWALTASTIRIQN